MGYKKYFNENLFDLAQKELHGRESPSPGLVIRMPNNLLGTGCVWKNSTATDSKAFVWAYFILPLLWILNIGVISA